MSFSATCSAAWAGGAELLDKPLHWNESPQQQRVDVLKTLCKPSAVCGLAGGMELLSMLSRTGMRACRTCLHGCVTEA